MIRTTWFVSFIGLTQSAFAGRFGGTGYPLGVPPKSPLFGRSRPHSWPRPAKKGRSRGRLHRPRTPTKRYAINAEIGKVRGTACRHSIVTLLLRRSLLFAFPKILRVLRNELDTTECPPDRLLQLAGAIDIDMTSLWVPELVDLLRVDIAGVHHRDKLQRLPIHYRHQRRVVAQQIKIGLRDIC